MSRTTPSLKVTLRRRSSIGSTSVTRSIVSMLRERFDREKRLELLRARPVVRELLRVQPGPLPHQAQRSRGQGPVDDSEAVELDLGDVFAVLRVEVRRGVIR